MLAPSPRRSARRLHVAAVWVALASLAITAPACNPARTAFDVNVASGLRREGASVAVFGLFKEGRMNPDVWTELAPKLSPAFGAKMCEAGYGDALRELDPKRYEGIDDAARDTGITAELLEPFASHAGGDLIVVFQVSGRVRTDDETFLVQKMNARRMAVTSETMTTSRSNGTFFGLEVVAMVYSVSAREMVGQVVMRYTGESVDEAMANFAEKLRAVFPGATCVPWKWDAPGASVPAPRL